MLLVKHVEVYSPEYLGKKDVLICSGKIEKIADEIDASAFSCEIVDGTGKILVPGFIDQHVHITGGGGEGSFHTRTPELQMSELVEAGITTVVGLLGTDGLTRSVENLYAKTRALKEEGVSAYMLTGAYGYPCPTITDRPDRDVVFIQDVIGVKLALSDHRAPNLSLSDLIRLASDIRVAGMLSGKAGVVVLHMGDAKSGLKPIFQALEETAIPAKTFRPTHVNRNPYLLQEGYEFLKKGGYVDLTCHMPGQKSASECIAEARSLGLPLDHITCSSDGHGSWSNYDENGVLLEIGVTGVGGIFHELRRMVKEFGIPLEEALTFVTSNVADSLELKSKGHIREAADADMLLLSSDLSLETVIAKGEVLMQDGVLLRRGTYEK